jgi:hypothetical protein
VPAANSLIPKEHLVNKIRMLGYRFQRKTDRVELYRHPVTMHRLAIPAKDSLDPDFVRATLYQAGMTKEQIEQFVGECSATSATRSRR